MQVARRIALEAGAPVPGRHRPAAPVRPGASARPKVLSAMLGTALWAALVGGALFYVYREAELARAGFALADLEQQLREWESRNEVLEARAADLRSIARIEKRAVELQMQKPVDFKLATVDWSAVVAREAPAGAPAPAAVAAAPASPAGEQVAGLWRRARDFLASFRLTSPRAEARGRP